MATLTDTTAEDRPSSVDALLEVEDLNVRFPTEDGVVHAVRGVSFALPPGRGGGHRRRVRLRQVGHLDGDHGPAGQLRADHRLGQVPRPGAARAQRRADVVGARQAGRDGLPGPDDVARPGLPDRQPDRRDRPAARQVGLPEGRDHPGGRAAQAGRHPERGGAGQLLPARVLRRHAAARRHRHRDGQPARGDHRRRADDGAGRDRPGAGARGAEEGAGRDRGGDGPDHPRPRRGRRDGRPGPGHVRRPRGREGGRRGRLLPSPDAVLDRPARLHAAHRRRRPAAAHPDQGRPAVDDQPAGRLPVRAPLPAALRPVRRG